MDEKPIASTSWYDIIIGFFVPRFSSVTSLKQTSVHWRVPLPIGCRPWAGEVTVSDVKVVTPLRPDVWARGLAPLPDEAFHQCILKGISEGFRIDYDRRFACRLAQSNMATPHPQFVSDYLEREVRLGRVSIVSSQDPRILKRIWTSPLGLILKKNRPNKWCLIIDLSSPRGMSMNDGIAEEWSSIDLSGPLRSLQLSRMLLSGFWGREELTSFFTTWMTLFYRISWVRKTVAHDLTWGVRPATWTLEAGGPGYMPLILGDWDRHDVSPTASASRETGLLEGHAEFSHGEEGSLKERPAKLSWLTPSRGKGGEAWAFVCVETPYPSGPLKGCKSKNVNRSLLRPPGVYFKEVPGSHWCWRQADHQGRLQLVM